MEGIKAKVLQYVISILFQFLTADALKELADKLLDFIEDKVKETGTGVDDAIALPLCQIIRTAFGIPDND